MTLRTLIRRSLRFHWRSHLGVVIGAAIGSAALTGALVVGDSVKGSLRQQALERLGGGSFLLHTGDRFFTQPLPDRVQAMANLSTLLGASAFHSGTTNAYPMAVNPELPSQAMLILPAVVTAHNGEVRLNTAQIIGLPNLYPALLPYAEWTQRRGEGELPKIPVEKVVLNAVAGRQLSAKPGDTIVVRFARPMRLSGDSILTAKSGQSISLRLEVDSVVTNSQLGDFAPTPSGVPRPTVFMPLAALASEADLDRSGREGDAYINTWLAPEVVRFKMADRSGLGRLLTGFRERLHRILRNPPSNGVAHESVGDAAQAEHLTQLLAEACELDDYQVVLRESGDGASVALTTSRIFLDPPIERAALAADTNAQPILTYIANLITSGTNTTPYSMVTAAGAPWTPFDLGDHEIVLNQWLADDLQAKPGDSVTLVYYDPESGARLTERTNTFRVHSVVPMEMPWADRTLMPDFPGIEKAESTADWDTAFPLTYTIRPKDDEYWREHRGTPKAFVTVAAGKKMWANRFGEVTAIRFPVPTNGAVGTPSTASQTQVDGDAVERVPTDAYREALEQKLLANLDPAELGLRFEPVREQALKAAAESQDFGGLFIGFSLFLIAAALILMALLFQFGLEQRSAEVGTLLALGFTHKQVRRLLLGEGAALALIGGVLGVVGGVFYARAMLLGLTTVWRDAVGGTALAFFVTPMSLAIGLFASTLVAVITIWLALRKQARQPAIRLLNADGGMPIGSTSRGQTRGAVRILTNAATIGGASLVLAVGLVGWALATGETTNAGVFFSAGALVLIGGLALMAWRLQSGAGVPLGSGEVTLSPGSRDGCATLTPACLAFRGLARRRSRSVATAALLASGSFLILSIGVFRLDANRDARERTAGTGGFTLIGEATLPVVQDLNTQAGRDAFALEGPVLEDVGFVQFRVRAGDEASCLNLNRAQKPRLLGVKPDVLADRFTFAKVAKGLDAAGGWQLLKSEIRNPKSEMDEVPAIGDANSIQWAMGKKVGDTIDYVDDRGQPFKVRIVGAVANSILQGNLIIDEAEFVKRFPNESGYQYFLMDAPANQLTEVSATLSRALQDHGLEVTPAVERLNQFNEVQNTYLGTFQILGGLGLLLGSAGLGIVVLRNVLERRGELAVLMAVGFRKRQVGRLVLSEHGILLGLGLAIGLLAATVAVLPTLTTPGSGLPLATLVPTLAAVLLNGFVSTWLSTGAALRGNLLGALRNE